MSLGLWNLINNDSQITLSQYLLNCLHKILKLSKFISHWHFILWWAILRFLTIGQYSWILVQRLWDVTLIYILLKRITLFSQQFIKLSNWCSTQPIYNSIEFRLIMTQYMSNIHILRNRWHLKIIKDKKYSSTGLYTYIILINIIKIVITTYSLTTSIINCFLS